MQLLEKYPDKICWNYLSLNPAAMHLLEQQPDKIFWPALSGNPAAMHLLEQHPDKINWTELSQNPSIFVYDYVTMKVSKRALHEDLIQNRFHPKYIDQFDGWGFGIDM